MLLKFSAFLQRSLSPKFHSFSAFKIDRENHSHNLRALFLGFMILSITGGKWLFDHTLSENARFEAFTESIFEKEVSGNALNLHYSLAYPEKQGIHLSHATLGTISTDYSKTTEQCKKYEEKLKSFSASSLSTKNQLTLDMLLLYYHTEASLDKNYLLEEPLDPSLGIQAQLPVLLAEYAFYDNQDITDYLNLLASLPDYFQSILTFEQAKSAAGYFMCDETLDRIQEQCRAFIQAPEDSYMQEIFAGKLKSYGRLSEKDQALLLQEHTKLLSQKVFPAYQQLIEGLEPLRHTGNNSGGLAHFSGGRDYYQYLLQSQVGVYTSVETLEKRLTQQLSWDSAQISAIIQKNPSVFTILKNKPDLPSMEPAKIMEILEQEIQKDFPTIGNVDFEIRSVHKSMEEFLSPAFYLTPPLDTGSPNVIYINYGRSISGLELFTTLAHEGFPGHLYQTVFFGRQTPSHIRYLIDSSGYVEGWATYVESYAYEYAANYLDLSATNTQSNDSQSNDSRSTNSQDNNSQDNTSPTSSQISPAELTRLTWLNRSVNLCIYSLLDVGIHYRGWSQSQTARFLGAFGIQGASAVSEIYRYITETPANYLKYYVGYLNFLDLKEEQSVLQGNDFDLKTFHQQILDIGPVQFPVLKKYMNQVL